MLPLPRQGINSSVGNLDLAARLLRELRRSGVETFVVAPGGRNAPLVALLEKLPLRRYTHFEERAAAFFALGLAARAEEPVAVITTSGTAAAELLPAAMEARLSGVPLVFVTADRPRRLRYTGAPQTVPQPGLFGPFAPTLADLEGEEPVDLSRWDRRRPVHINVCFEEPLLADEADAPVLPPPAPPPPRPAPDPTPLREFLARVRLPVVLVGALLPREVSAVRAFLLRLGAPCLLEGASMLQGDPALAPLAAADERLLAALPADGVLRLGGVPAARFWRDLEERRGLPVLSVSRLPFPGLSRGALLEADLERLLPQIVPPPCRFDRAAWSRRNRERAAHLARLTATCPCSEPALVHALSRFVPEDARVYLGNSLPVREWDLAAVPASAREIRVSRGVCGIDGQVSTFLGLAAPDRENWALLGDLTALYDLAALWVLDQLPSLRLRLVVVNNGGGRIFARLFDAPVFQNRHDRRLKPWAELWGLPYVAWRGGDFPPALPDRCLLEVLPDPEETERFWAGFDALP